MRGAHAEKYRDIETEKERQNEATRDVREIETAADERQPNRDTNRGREMADRKQSNREKERQTQSRRKGQRQMQRDRDRQKETETERDR